MKSLAPRLVLGHRGGRGPSWPAENTLPAFERALAEGADGVELDVRLTADGVPVVLHDVTLARITEDKDTREVGRVPAGDLPRLAGGERIPSLDDALDMLRDHVVNIELKGDIRPGAVTLDAAARVGLARAAARSVARVRPKEVVFSSFDPTIVLSLVAIAPRVPRGMLVGRGTPRAAMPLALGMRPAVHAAHVDESLLTRDRVARLVAAGLRVCAWTVNDVARAEELYAWGVAWVITDDPASVALVRPALSRR